MGIVNKFAKPSDVNSRTKAHRWTLLIRMNVLMAKQTSGLIVYSFGQACDSKLMTTWYRSWRCLELQAANSSSSLSRESFGKAFLLVKAGSGNRRLVSQIQRSSSLIRDSRYSDQTFGFTRWEVYYFWALTYSTEISLHLGSNGRLLSLSKAWKWTRDHLGTDE